jgi:hypothetical protein
MRSKDKKAPSAGAKAQNKARKAYEEAVLRAFRTFMENKEKADIAHEKALKQATDKQARGEADIKYKETLEQARKVRDEIMDEARKALNDARE